MKALLLEIARRIEATGEFAYVSVDWGQLKFENPPVAWPCVLVDLANAVPRDAHEKIQTIDGHFVIKVADYIDSGIGGETPAQTLERELKIYDLIDVLHDRLQGYENGTYSPLSRRAIRKDESIPGLRQFTIEYAATWKDQVPPPERTKIKTELRINPFIQKK